MTSVRLAGRRFWKFLRPELREILYLVLGFLLGLASTWYFEIQNATERKVTLLRGAINEVNLNMLPSWYPMYHDSVSRAKDDFPYPLLDGDALSNLRKEVWLFRESLPTDSSYSLFVNALAETAGEISEFNERIRLRNDAIIVNNFAILHNQLAFEAYQTRVLPKLTGCKRLLDSIHETIAP